MTLGGDVQNGKVLTDKSHFSSPNHQEVLRVGRGSVAGQVRPQSRAVVNLKGIKIPLKFSFYHSTP